MTYLLDTNVVLTYIRNNATARGLEANLKLLSNENTLILSVVTIGELRSIAKQARWGQRKLDQMENL
ncbi:MAG: hypothetical protein AAGJ82_06955, partial [Bacteroidota bacterium]